MAARSSLTSSTVREKIQHLSVPESSIAWELRKQYRAPHHILFPLEGHIILPYSWGSVVYCG